MSNARLLALAAERGYSFLQFGMWKSPAGDFITEAEVLATARRWEHPLDLSMPVVTRIWYRVVCKHCKGMLDRVIDCDTPDFNALEVQVHEDIEDQGWVDGLCLACLRKECGV